MEEKVKKFSYILMFLKGRFAGLTLANFCIFHFDYAEFTSL